MKRWSIRVCRKCGSDHGRFHDGCVTYSHPMFPQMTEHAGVDTIEVVPAAHAERLRDVARLLAACDGSLIPHDHTMDDLFERKLLAFDSLGEQTYMTRAGVEFVTAALADELTHSGGSDAR